MQRLLLGFAPEGFIAAGFIAAGFIVAGFIVADRLKAATAELEPAGDAA